MKVDLLFKIGIRKKQKGFKELKKKMNIQVLNLKNAINNYHKMIIEKSDVIILINKTILIW